MTSWRKEYIQILEHLASASTEVRLSYPNDKRKGPLLKELKDADFIEGRFYIGPQADVSITYKGRLELDRLKSQRPLDRLVSYAGSAIVFAAGAVVTKLLDWIPEIIKHFTHHQ